MHRAPAGKRDCIGSKVGIRMAGGLLLGRQAGKQAGICLGDMVNLLQA